MRRKARLAAAAVVLILLAVVASSPGVAQEAPAHSLSIWFGSEISITPDTDGEGLWNCQAILKDLVTGEVLSAPTVVFAAGEEASVQSGLPDGMVWELEVEVSADGDDARWSSKVRLDEQIVNVSTGSIRLTAEQ